MEVALRNKGKVILVLVKVSHWEGVFWRKEAQCSHSGRGEKGRWAQRQESANTGVGGGYTKGDTGGLAASTGG